MGVQSVVRYPCHVWGSTGGGTSHACALLKDACRKGSNHRLSEVMQLSEVPVDKFPPPPPPVSDSTLFKAGLLTFPFVSFHTRPSSFRHGQFHRPGLFFLIVQSLLLSGAQQKKPTSWGFLRVNLKLGHETLTFRFVSPGGKAVVHPPYGGPWSP